MTKELENAYYKAYEELLKMWEEDEEKKEDIREGKDLIDKEMNSYKDKGSTWELLVLYCRLQFILSGYEGTINLLNEKRFELEPYSAATSLIKRTFENLASEELGDKEE